MTNDTTAKDQKPESSSMYSSSSLGPSHPEQARVSAEWDAMAGEWDDLAVGYRDAFFKILTEQVISPKQRDDFVVVDFGCGTGLLAEVLRTRVSRVVCLDAAPMMVQQVQDKIRAGEWNNVEAHCVVLAAQQPQQQQSDGGGVLEALRGKVDMIVASSVLSFVPEADYAATMKALGDLLKSRGGILCHSDWPKSESHTDGFTYEHAAETYRLAGLESKSVTIVPFIMGEEQVDVFVGVAVKP